MSCLEQDSCVLIETPAALIPITDVVQQTTDEAWSHDAFVPDDKVIVSTFRLNP